MTKNRSPRSTSIVTPIRSGDSGVPKDGNEGFSFKDGKWQRFILNETINSDFPEGLKFAGNYAIFINGNCIYIGQSENVKKRLKTHIQMARFSNHWKTTWGYFLRLWIAVRKEKFRFERVLIEVKLIHRIKPNYNKLLKAQKIKSREIN